MDHPVNSTSDSLAEVHRTLRAIRFALVAIVLGLSYFSIRSALNISAFEQVLTDMLSGKSLPALTRTIFAWRPTIIVTSLVLPLAALGTLLARDLVRSFYLIGGVALTTIALIVVLFHAFFVPLNEIVEGMSGLAR